MNIRIRHANKNDLSAMLEIYNEVVLNSPATFDLVEQSLESREQWFKQFDEQYPIIVAEQAEEILGYSCLTKFRPKPAYASTVEDSIYIKSKARGHGVGSMLLEKLINEAKKNNHHSIIAVIANDERSSVQLHEKFGYEKTGLIKEAGYKFDRWHDIHFYQLILEYK
ncbi:GNAT family N-acetyltransferase [Pseudalkalibacillus berkeleyi]|uniref:N-acetyltransferase family protein n=1 Tax=Pseudalkalibacillus berkeleyi TaxID=1069813 RepID=A0ABS9GX10_9BACL|nr:GNAT family N-acetyltransferase [Pseudalkalibacillus berkeleyi]MCF6136130.1 N-acetyltransferase family protein [Pseudalkalibacillus berkeleyi]